MMCDVHGMRFITWLSPQLAARPLDRCEALVYVRRACIRAVTRQRSLPVAKTRLVRSSDGGTTSTLSSLLPTQIIVPRVEMSSMNQPALYSPLAHWCLKSAARRPWQGVGRSGGAEAAR